MSASVKIQQVSAVKQNFIEDPPRRWCNSSTVSLHNESHESDPHSSS